MNKIFKTIRSRRIFSTFVFIFCGLLYYAQGLITKFYFPCLIYKTTGLLCPSCGITHMAVALLQFRFADAFYANIGLALISPLLAVVLFIYWFNWINSKQEQSKILTALTLFCVIYLVAWGIFRNLYVNVDIQRILVV